MDSLLNTDDTPTQEVISLRHHSDIILHTHYKYIVVTTGISDPPCYRMLDVTGVTLSGEIAFSIGYAHHFKGFINHTLSREVFHNKHACMVFPPVEGQSLLNTMVVFINENPQKQTNTFIVGQTDLSV